MSISYQKLSKKQLFCQKLMEKHTHTKAASQQNFGSSNKNYS